MSENEKKVPTVVVKRLPRYYRYLGELLKQDIKRISSNALSVKMNVTASQIRQDFNYFGGFGQQGYGYNVEHLYNEIGDILGLNDGDTTVIVGAGNLGRALASHDRVDIGILTVPKAAVMETAEKLVNCGVKGLMNFSYTELKFDKDVAVENVHLSDPLMTLSYKIKQNQN